MPTLLLKTEPTEYSIDDLIRDKGAVWDGISNNAALGWLRTATKGLEVFIYHTGDEKAIVGTATVTQAPYEDPQQPGRTPKGEPKFAVVDLKAGRKAKTPLTLAAMKADPSFRAFELLRQPRLSVVPVPDELGRTIRAKTGL